MFQHWIYGVSLLDLRYGVLIKKHLLRGPELTEAELGILPTQESRQLNTGS